MTQQTAVEWLENELNIKGKLTAVDFYQAKQMEKEQIENARPQIISNCVIKEISDEEIEKFASDFYDNNGADEFIIMGAKWYREQLKNK